MSDRYRFNRLELAGSFGDLGTLLPIAIAILESFYCEDTVQLDFFFHEHLLV